MNDIARAEQHALSPSAVGAEHLSFSLGMELFAIGIHNVKEIIEYTRPDTVPLTPDYLRGVINLRGTAVPVMDQSLRRGRGVSSVTRRSCIIVVELDETTRAGAGPQGRSILLLNAHRVFSRAEPGTALAAVRVMP